MKIRFRVRVRVRVWVTVRVFNRYTTDDHSILIADDKNLYTLDR